MIKIIFLITAVVLFFELGNIFDITTPPKKADIIVCLGGGDIQRLQKAQELYHAGFSKQKRLIYTGSNIFYHDMSDNEHAKKYYKKAYFLAHGIPRSSLVHIWAHNTMTEIRRVKKYMLDHHYKSVIFVTDPPHSRRIDILLHHICNYDKMKIQTIIVGSDAWWWDKEKYFLSKNASIYIFLEMIKIVYNYILYGVIERFGAVSFFEKNFAEAARDIKSFLLDKISREWEEKN